MSTAPEAPKAGDAFDVESIAREIEDNLAGLLGLEPGARIDRRKRLRALGMDSLLAMDLISALETRHGQLVETVIRDHPTVQELAEFLCSRHQQKGG